MGTNILQSAKQRIDTLNPEGLRENVPQYIVLHSTVEHSEFEDVLECHRKRDFAGMGYHLFLADSGDLTQGRPFNLEGAHALGFNTNSIGLAIHSYDGRLGKGKIIQGRKIIENLREMWGDLEVISHTYAQVVFNNRLLEEYGLDLRFPETEDVARGEVFSRLKESMEYFTGSLDSGKFPSLKRSLKSFKNCPGEMFYHFV